MVNKLKRRGLLLTTIAALGALAVSGVADAQRVRVGDIILTAYGGFTPQRLPKHENAPITINGGAEVSTVSGAYPPILDSNNIEFDRHGSLETTGLPTCTEHKLEATTVPQARRACPGAIVGKGYGHAIVVFPESKPLKVDSPITLFNGPKKGGNSTVIAHAYTTYPAAVTLIIPIVIERIHKGIYGYRTKVKIPRIAGGNGIPISGRLTIGRKWTYKGQKHSYINARCETGHLQARVEATFKDDSFLSGVFTRACQVRK